MKEELVVLPFLPEVLFWKPSHHPTAMPQSPMLFLMSTALWPSFGLRVTQRFGSPTCKWVDVISGKGMFKRP